jgi:hypothetical protein
MKPQELGISQQEEGAVSVAPKNEAAEEVTASGAMHDVSGTEHEISSGTVAFASVSFGFVLVRVRVA